jgi:hypothetical protein
VSYCWPVVPKVCSAEPKATATSALGIRGYISLPATWKFTYFLTFWHRSFTFNSNKSLTWCNNFSVYYPDVCLQLNMFRAFSRPSSGAQWLQWQPDFTFVSWWQPCCVRGRAGRLSPRYEGKIRLPLQSLSSWWWAGKRPKHVKL